MGVGYDQYENCCRCASIDGYQQTSKAGRRSRRGLRGYCPDHLTLDPDELACIVLSEVLERKRKARQANRLSDHCL